MATAERRRELLKILCRRRRESIKNSASEFGVSERTIQRDIEELSLTEPIYTQPGRYGGVYIVDGYCLDRMYMNDTEIGVLKKLYAYAENNMSLLTSNEKKILELLILQYSKPILRKGK